MADELVALLVNAGGQSQRMGRSKALLTVPGTEMPLVAHIIHRLLPLANDRVVVVSNDPAVVEVVNQIEEAIIVADQWPVGGALGGLATGLAACAAWAMVVACDMPFVEPAIFVKLADVAKSRREGDAVMPRVAGQAQPFHGLWHRRSVPSLAARLSAGELGVQAALAALHVVWMDELALQIAPDTPAFYNVNTPGEWREAQVILAKQKGR